MNTRDDKLQRLLGGLALAPLRQRLRRHFERHGDGGVGQCLQLSQLNAAESEALSLLTGRPPRTARSIRLDITAIGTALRAAGICDSLREALERLDGPIIHLAAARAAQQAAWSRLIHAHGRDARLQAWLCTEAATGLLKRLAQQDTDVAHTLLRQADAVLRCLPAAGLTRAQLAARQLGDAHGLDAGRPVGTLVLAAWRNAELAATAAETGHARRRESDDPAQSEQRVGERARDTWARAGVLVNELARPALVLNLPGMAASCPGEPAYLSLRQLLRAPLVWPVAGMEVFVCENPNLLAISADRLGARCAPLVCTDGMPAAAQRTLLNQLLQHGAKLCYHGDFDWPGLRIAHHVITHWQARPWRMSADDYDAAVRTAPHAQRNLEPVEFVASWDPSLTARMRAQGLSIAEEAVADMLMEDLAVDRPGFSRQLRRCEPIVF